MPNLAWILRARTALAYLAKLLFRLSIGSAFTQRLWQSLRSKDFTPGAIDNLFDLKNGPTRLLKFEILASAKIAILLALLVWYGILPENVCLQLFPIQTLNFSRSYDTPLIGSPTYTVNFADIQGNGATFNAYTGPSSRAKGLIYSTVYGGQILTPDSPCGSNCTFNQTFIRPAYQCQDVDYTKANPQNPFCGEQPCGESHFSSPTNNAFDIEWFLNPLNYSYEGFEGGLDLDPYAEYATHQLLYSILSGQIGLDGQMRPIDTTRLGGTQLVE
ncbi:hypothetical protein G7Y89_g13448 [Cudoniella acicularis]|uniref:Uncharacterized protein n=1 Tax=Cudoniella acicularis TaxID=354080 RepID=A0A8H4VW20_9HELO|nr:hypothetical protein G7Y89_g13448 [Cudoniella acicularis]